MSKIILTENTVIGKSAIPPDKYRSFLRKEIDDFSPEVFCGDFKNLLDSHTGKTLKDLIESYYMMAERKSMDERLTEERFNNISESDKSFIKAFDRTIAQIGYEFGGKIGSGFCWGTYMIIYTKAGVKSKQVSARIFIRENHIVLRLFFNNIAKHSKYIENAPEHIKNVFTGTHGNCSCNPRKDNCHFRKTYTIDGKLIEKCSGVVFEFWQPNMEKLPDYMGLLNEFYAGNKKDIEKKVS